MMKKRKLKSQNNYKKASRILKKNILEVKTKKKQWKEKQINDGKNI